MIRVASSGGATRSLRSTARVVLSSANPRHNHSSTITSRRAWTRLQQQQPLQSKPAPTAATPKKTPKPTDPGWPKSVRYTGYGLAATLGPYSILWLVANTPSLRDYLSESQLDTLRHYYGSPEHDQELHMLEKNKNNNQKTTVVLQLPGEPTARERRVHASQVALDQSELGVKVTLGGNNDTTRTVTIQVPAHVLARTSDLQNYLTEAIGNSQTTMSALALDFVTPSHDQASDLYQDKDDNATIDSTAAITKDPLLHDTMVYSAWHHHPTTTSTSNTTSPLAQQSARHDDSIRQQQLKAEIQALQYEFQMGSLRDMDDIQQELVDKKAQLRRLQWKKWVLW